jgi:hypothetical protein
MKPVVLQFVKGGWDGRRLRTDSPDREEALLATACYEMSHHGAIGQECAGLLADEETFAQKHGWATGTEGDLQRHHRYIVFERCETVTETVVKLRYQPDDAG